MAESHASSIVADEAPRSEQITDYDRLHLTTYARLLDADADGACDEEIIRLVLLIDPSREPDRANRCFASHMRRARWMSERGYRHLLVP